MKDNERSNFYRLQIYICSCPKDNNFIEVNCYDYQEVKKGLKEDYEKLKNLDPDQRFLALKDVFIRFKGTKAAEKQLERIREKMKCSLTYVQKVIAATVYLLKSVPGSEFSVLYTVIQLLDKDKFGE